MNNITVIGGGTGSFVVLSGLKRFPEVNLNAIVPSTDSGGSTGRLKDEFGYLPVGDVRQCLVALADDEDEMLLRQLFGYRFDKGEGLRGHNFGNLFLTALADIYQGEVNAIKAVRKLLKIKGGVYPVTLDSTNLVAEYENGSKLIGEHHIDEPPYPHDPRLRITKLYTEPEVATHKGVLDVIKKSDYIVLGPGDVYSSILANIIVTGVADAIVTSKAKLIFVMNLVTKFGQTAGFTAKDHIRVMEEHIGREVDHIILNSSPLPEDILLRYALQNDFPIQNDIEEDARAVSADLLAREEIVTNSGDILQRSLIRHDPAKLAQEIYNLVA